MRKALILMAALTAAPATAQEEDRRFLADFIEDSLSGAGRQVTITGFTGALSSRAQIERLAIADDLGIWITLTGVTLDWSRSSLLSGALEVSELTAETIVIDRIPDTGDATAPSPEASGFSLPELPVSIDIGRIAADQILLGEAVLGQPIEGSIEANLQLVDGAGDAKLEILRYGAGANGEIVLDASYDNATRQLEIDLSASEAEGGIVTELLGIPGAPQATLDLQGSGPIDAFAAEIRLATDGEERLAGDITLNGTAEGGYRLQAEVSGNLAPLVVPNLVDFFGNEVALSLDAERSANGAVTVDRLGVKARALQFEGQLGLAADGLPERIALVGTIASPDGEAVLLPFGDTETRIDRGTFDVSLTQAEGTGWTGNLSVEGLTRPGLAVSLMEVAGSGRIGRTAAGNSFGGTVTLAAKGLSPEDEDLARALGPELGGGFKLFFLEGSNAVTLSNLRLAGAGFTGTGNLQIEGIGTGLLTSGWAEVKADDLSRYAGLVGRAIGGSGTLRIEGSASPLSGLLDAAARVEGEDLEIGIAAVDRLLVGASVASISVLRNEEGTRLRSLDLTAGPLTATAAGTIASDGSNLSGNVALTDLAVLGPSFGGSANLDATFTGLPESGRIVLDGMATGLRVGNPEADRILAGASRLSADLALSDGRVTITDAQLANPQLSVSATGEVAGALRRVVLDARLANLGLLVPRLQGPLTVTGEATDDGNGYVLDLRGRGPGQVDATIAGRVAADFASADLAVAGTGQAALANIFLSPRSIDGPVRFDLRLAGPLRLASLSGRVTLANGRLSDPNLGFALDGIEALADLQGGQAQISATSRLSSGGRLRIDGPIGLTPPFEADLAVSLDQIRLYDPELYEATIGGNLTIRGPLRGGALIAGAISVGEAEVRVPDSGFGGAETIAAITHVNEPAEVRATRARAGLLNLVNGGGGGANSAGGGFGLDLTISAPSRIFVRGRGIDAELGGQLRLLGTTRAIVPSGSFSLIRGRLDILGRRLVLNEADLVLEGSFVPVLLVTANTETDGVTSTIRIAGPADNPVVSFTSVPDLPQEEVLARLLFGRGLDSISPLQAAQLANAVASLAGRGGVGLVNRLRTGFGLDDLDLATAEDGTTALTAGKYLSDNLYTEIEIEQGGRTSINLNLDLREGVTVKAGLGADGDTGLGIFVERDY